MSVTHNSLYVWDTTNSHTWHIYHHLHAWGIHFFFTHQPGMHTSRIHTHTCQHTSLGYTHLGYTHTLANTPAWDTHPPPSTHQPGTQIHLPPHTNLGHKSTSLHTPTWDTNPPPSTHQPGTPAALVLYKYIWVWNRRHTFNQLDIIQHTVLCPAKPHHCTMMIYTDIHDTFHYKIYSAIIKIQTYI
ncbi:hypothetical protein BsWGS_28863 [Bradybaena similaris]